MVPCCPNPQCTSPEPRKHGTFYRASDAKVIQRWVCLGCKRPFSAATFQAAYLQNKRRTNPEVAKLLSSGVSQRRIALPWPWKRGPGEYWASRSLPFPPRDSWPLSPDRSTAPARIIGPRPYKAYSIKSASRWMRKVGPFEKGLPRWEKARFQAPGFGVGGLDSAARVNVLRLN